MAVTEARKERSTKLEFAKLELKICERCGGLWLRPAGTEWTYCRPCKARIDELPPVRLKPGRKGRAR